MTRILRKSGASDARPPEAPFSGDVLFTHLGFHLSSSLEKTRRMLSWRTATDAFVWIILLSFLVSGSGAVGARQRVRKLAEQVALHWGDERPGALHVVIVLQPNDCMGMTAILNRFSFLLERVDVPVEGLLLTNRSDRIMADRLIASDVVSFGLQKVDSTDLTVVFRAFGIAATPIVVLVDARGRVRYLGPLEADLAATEAEVSRIRGIVSELRGAQ